MIKGGTLFREDVYAFEFNTGRPIKDGTISISIHKEDDECFLFEGTFEDGDNDFMIRYETFADCLADVREKVRTLRGRVLRPLCDFDKEEN